MRVAVRERNEKRKIDIVIGQFTHLVKRKQWKVTNQTHSEIKRNETKNSDRIRLVLTLTQCLCLY